MSTSSPADSAPPPKGEKNKGVKFDKVVEGQPAPERSESRPSTSGSAIMDVWGKQRIGLRSGEGRSNSTRGTAVSGPQELQQLIQPITYDDLFAEGDTSAPAPKVTIDTGSRKDESNLWYPSESTGARNKTPPPPLSVTKVVPQPQSASSERSPRRSSAERRGSAMSQGTEGGADPVGRVMELRSAHSSSRHDSVKAAALMKVERANNVLQDPMPVPTLDAEPTAGSHGQVDAAGTDGGPGEANAAEAVVAGEDVPADKDLPVPEGSSYVEPAGKEPAAEDEKPSSGDNDGPVPDSQGSQETPVDHQGEEEARGGDESGAEREGQVAPNEGEGPVPTEGDGPSPTGETPRPPSEDFSVASEFVRCFYCNGELEAPQVPHGDMVSCAHHHCPFHVHRECAPYVGSKDLDEWMCFYHRDTLTPMEPQRPRRATAKNHRPAPIQKGHYENTRLRIRVIPRTDMPNKGQDSTVESLIVVGRDKNGKELCIHRADAPSGDLHSHIRARQVRAQRALDEARQAEAQAAREMTNLVNERRTSMTSAVLDPTTTLIRRGSEATVLAQMERAEVDEEPKWKGLRPSTDIMRHSIEVASKGRERDLLDTQLREQREEQEDQDEDQMEKLYRKGWRERWYPKEVMQALHDEAEVTAREEREREQEKARREEKLLIVHTMEEKVRREREAVEEAKVRREKRQAERLKELEEKFKAEQDARVEEAARNSERQREMRDPHAPTPLSTPIPQGLPVKEIVKLQMQNKPAEQQLEFVALASQQEKDLRKVDMKNKKIEATGNISMVIKPVPARSKTGRAQLNGPLSFLQSDTKRFLQSERCSDTVTQAQQEAHLERIIKSSEGRDKAAKVVRGPQAPTGGPTKPAAPRTRKRAAPKPSGRTVKAVPVLNLKALINSAAASGSASAPERENVMARVAGLEDIESNTLSERVIRLERAACRLKL